MKYKIIDIFEDDFGCEGLPEGEELFVTVVLKNENESKSVRVSDSLCTEKGFRIGDTVTLDENGNISK